MLTRASECVIGLSVFASDARSCLASGKDWPIKANKQNKLLPDPVHSQNTEEVLGRAATVWQLIYLTGQFSTRNA